MSFSPSNLRSCQASWQGTYGSRKWKNLGRARELRGSYFVTVAFGH